VHPSNEDLKSPTLVEKILVHLHQFHSVKVKEGRGMTLPTEYLWTETQIKELTKYESLQMVPAYQNLKAKIMQILDHQSIWRRKLMP